MVNQPETLNSLNPTGTIHGDYSPSARASAPLGPDITTLSETMGVERDTLVTVYLGIPKDATQSINPGDFITTSAQLARDYAGTGSIVKKQVPASDVLDSRSEPLGEEYIYRPPNARRLGKADVTLAVSERATSISSASRKLPRSGSARSARRLG